MCRTTHRQLCVCSSVCRSTTRADSVEEGLGVVVSFELSEQCLFAAPPQVIANFKRPQTALCIAKLHVQQSVIQLHAYKGSE